ncbi:MAG: hypothetical protein EOP09_04650 [Proteobacteria bacterium]|nr:MAG: hypothetical protein EOP09_04650 [Pseudomonadota bacterium]
MLASVLYDPNLGETFGRMLCYVFAFLSPTIVIAYFLAYLLRKRTDNSIDKAEQGGGGNSAALPA